MLVGDGAEELRGDRKNSIDYGSANGVVSHTLWPRNPLLVLFSQDRGCGVTPMLDRTSCDWCGGTRSAASQQRQSLNACPN